MKEQLASIVAKTEQATSNSYVIIIKEAQGTH